MLCRLGVTFACTLLAACGAAEQMTEQVRKEPWRMVMTPSNRYMALFDEHYNAGMRWFYRKDFDSAIFSFRQAYAAAERLKLEQEKSGGPLTLALSMMSNALRGLGIAHSEQRKYAEAESYHRRALEIRESLHGPGVAHFLNDLAVNYRKQGRYGEAMPLHERAARIFEKAGNRFELAVVLNNIGHLQDGQGRNADAETFFGRALGTTEEAMGHNRGPDHPGWFQRILHIKDYAAAVRKSGRGGEADRLDARLKELISEERKHAAALRERGQADAAGFRETRLADVLSD
jgi:tetratricopeptide (TPR) repeat protein